MFVFLNQVLAFKTQFNKMRPRRSFQDVCSDMQLFLPWKIFTAVEKDALRLTD